MNKLKHLRNIRNGSFTLKDLEANNKEKELNKKGKLTQKEQRILDDAFGEM